MNSDQIKEMLRQAIKNGNVEVVGTSDSGAVLGVASQPRAINPKPIPEAQIDTLRELAAIYLADKVPFKVGDLVTPRATSILRGQGHPFLVIEVAEKPEPNFDAESSSPEFGSRFNLRVMGYAETGENVLAWWNEAFHYEPWFPKVKSEKQQS